MKVVVYFALFMCIFFLTGTSATSKVQESAEEIDVRVINGQNARLHQFPWQVSLRFNSNGRHTCGGSLLSTTWVVTAAHCVKKNPDARAYFVVLGALYQSRTVPGEQKRQLKRLIYHSYFSFGHFRHDVAMLELAQPVSYTSGIQKISLPNPGSKIPVGTNCYLSGWGRTVANGPGADILQWAVLPIAHSYHCSNVNGRLIQVDPNSMLCAGGQGRAGGCQGDSGGPLACNEGGTWVLRGIVSWGHQLCYTNHYTVFARVSNLVNWMRSSAG